MKTFTKVTVMTAALLTSLIGATSANAGELGDEISFTYSKSAPIEQTYAKLTFKANRECRNELGVYLQKAGRKCVETYVETILEKVNSPELTAYHTQTQNKTDGYKQFADASATVSIGK